MNGFLFLFFALLTLASCERHADVVRPAARPHVDEVNFTLIESPSLQFLPRQQEAKEWKLEEDPIVVPGDRLMSYLDQDGARFAHYAALDMSVGKYAPVTGDGFATVEIFRFPDFVKAFGAYSTRKEGSIQLLSLANESFATAHTIHIWRGPFYVRIVGNGPDGSVLRLAQFVADRMPAAPGKPAVFNFLPDKLRVPNSERYSADSGLGQTYLGNSFQAQFNVDGDMITGLVIPAANKQAAGQILEAYRQLYIHNGKLLDPIPNLGEDNFTAEDKFLGRSVAFRIDRFVIVFNGFRERQHLVDLAIVTDQRILGSIRKQLVTADKQAETQSDQHKQGPAWTRPRQ